MTFTFLITVTKYLFLDVKLVPGVFQWNRSMSLFSLMHITHNEVLVVGGGKKKKKEDRIQCCLKTILD